ncbi:two-component system histidine kinase PnpS [Clostridium cochlearium]|uniref:histidine kinase n=2 Tax=Clostridium cochlearium TaxID=1494 RepID=A0A239ZRT7_CLOCO|nr:sensor histidine kinase [Clostridium cochlearium]MBE6064192.1 cell wall metabolism sensor histidine kinase WalK [Clostridium cochlearium]MDU1442432.1 ATP-binding protein [Clostridium cochlearium]NOH16541.1 HAMP domain-containing protein [Clostridium cochlearium]SDK80154.1 two-component system, OmpR family, phosphate regulon sensor histidine kinase PhoR [Clostridium cochlearium]SNV73972.1 phosphate regulon sensor protein phoR [Clostridium cochlearium]
MKKRLMRHMLVTLTFSMIFVITFFAVITNYRYMENSKANLKVNNEIVSKMLESNDIKNKNDIIPYIFGNSDIRITCLDQNDKLIFDSQLEKQQGEFYGKRDEIIEARKNGEALKIRYSESKNKNTIYFAKVLKSGIILRTSTNLNDISIVQGKYSIYYLIIIILSSMGAFIFASKLSSSIVKPIKKLEFITSRIAAGELDRRVNIKSKDEIGQLSNTFNNMADKLQYTINDSIEKQNKLEAILKSMDNGVIAVDKDFRIIMINPYAKEIFDIEEDIIGENLLDRIKSYELKDIFKQDNIEEYREVKIFYPKEKDLRIKTTDIKIGKQLIGTVAVVQDVTEIKKLENMRSQFVANVTHELKTPLTSIRGFAETLKYVEDKETKDKFLNIINDEADRLTRLINDILALSDIENNKDMKQESIHVNEILEDIVYLMENSSEEKNIELFIVGDKVSNIKGDKDKFKQMMINLVDNGIKYTEEGGKVYIGAKEEENNCVLWVEDTGVGISKEHIERLFERFYRVDKARSRRQGGTGLGLAIVKHIVLGFNGTINIESEEGKGSKFIIKIPIS